MFHTDFVVDLKHAGESQVQVKLNRTFIRGADAIRLLKIRLLKLKNITLKMWTSRLLGLLIILCCSVALYNTGLRLARKP